MKVHHHCSPGSEAVAANMAWVKAIARQAQLEDRCFHCRVSICCYKSMPVGYLGVKMVLMIVVVLVVCWVMWVMRQIKALHGQSGVVRASW